MKIIAFKSGLGNQIFCYLLCEYFRDKGEEVYSYSNNKYLRQHNGLEINRFFQIDFPSSPWYVKLISNNVRIFCRFFPSLKTNDANYRDDALYYDGNFQDKRFFNDNIKKIKFQIPVLSVENTDVIKKIKDRYAVSLHVRRGDYLDPVRIEKYGKACGIEYYEKALGVVESRAESPLMVVFSDDIPWVKENIKALSEFDCVFVDWNKDADSYLDMYLMSLCDASIIANSTFSYWGAMLGNNKDFVIRPKIWIGEWVPDIFPDNWIAI